jgi:hypothetical protein
MAEKDGKLQNAIGYIFQYATEPVQMVGSNFAKAMINGASAGKCWALAFATTHIPLLARDIIRSANEGNVWALKTILRYQRQLPKFHKWLAVGGNLAKAKAAGETLKAKRVEELQSSSAEEIEQISKQFGKKVNDLSQEINKLVPEENSTADADIMQKFNTAAMHMADVIEEMTTLSMSQKNFPDTIYPVMNEYCGQLHELKKGLSEKVITLYGNPAVGNRGDKLDLFMEIESAYYSTMQQLYSDTSDDVRNHWLHHVMGAMPRFIDILVWNNNLLYLPLPANTGVLRDCIQILQSPVSDSNPQDKERLDLLRQILEIFVSITDTMPNQPQPSLQFAINKLIVQLRDLNPNPEQQSLDFFYSLSGVMSFLRSNNYIAISANYLNFLIAYLNINNMLCASGCAPAF